MGVHRYFFLEFVSMVQENRPSLPLTKKSPATKKIRNRAPTVSQLKWLRQGLSQAGGKLPLFDEKGQKISARTVRSCVESGWAEPWFSNPVKPDWLVCKLTVAGRKILKSPP